MLKKYFLEMKKNISNNNINYPSKYSNYQRKPINKDNSDNDLKTEYEQAIKMINKKSKKKKKEIIISITLSSVKKNISSIINNIIFISKRNRRIIITVPRTKILTNSSIMTSTTRTIMLTNSK